MKRHLIKGLTFVILLSLICCVFATSVSAATFENVPYDSFAYWNNSEKAVPVKSMFSLVDEINGADFGFEEGLNTPTDIFLDNTYLYLLDSDNSRVIIADKKTYNVVSIICDPIYNGEELHFRDAEGVYANDGKVYICDTSNERLIISDMTGNVSKVVTCPDSDIIPENFIFAPTRIASDKNGFFYLISNGCFYGAMRFDSDFNFLGFFGANVTSVTVADIFSNVIGKIFNTNEKISGQAKQIPFQFVDLSVDAQNFIYTVTNAGDTGAIRRLNPGGTNVYSVLVDNKYQSSDSTFFGVIGSINRTHIEEKSRLISVSVDENEFVYVLDEKFGRVLVYDKYGVMLCAFGGGLERGSNKGTFEKPSSIHIDGDLLYVVDTTRNSITVFRMTEFGKKLTTASSLTNNGEYEKSIDIWQEVLDEDVNCQAAYNGLAKAMLSTGNYQEALKLAKQGKNPSLYGEAFAKVRDEFVENNFYLIVAIVVILILAIVAFVIIKRKKNIVIFKDRSFFNGLSACIHPFAAYKNLKENKRKNIIVATIFVFLFFVVTVIYDFFAGYMYGHKELSTYNAFITFIATSGVLLLYTVANWAVCSVQGGKGRMYEVYIGVAYSIVPIIIYRLFTLLISNVMTMEEAFFLNVFGIVAWIFTGFSLLVANMEIHEYDFFKVLKTTIIIVLGMGLIIFLLFMVIILIQQLFSFVETVYNELSLR